jgi:hypothetical protein
VGEADLGHVLGLGDVDPDQEPIPLRAEILLQFPTPGSPSQGSGVAGCRPPKSR